MKVVFGKDYEMKIDVTQTPVDPKGDPFMLRGKAMDLRDIMYDSLGGCMAKQQTISANRDRTELAKRILAAKKYVELTLREAAEVQECLAKVFGPFVVTAVSEILEGKTSDADKPACKKTTKKKAKKSR